MMKHFENSDDGCTQHGKYNLRCRNVILNGENLLILFCMFSKKLEKHITLEQKIHCLSTVTNSSQDLGI